MLRRTFITGLVGVTLATATLGALPALASPNPSWVHLGTHRVSHHLDRDIIQVGREEGRFERIFFRVHGNGLNVQDVRVIYANGTDEHLAVSEFIPEGGDSRQLDLRGWRRSIDRIELVYESSNRHRPAATVHVYGLKSASFEPDPMPAPAHDRGWEVIGTARAGHIVDHDTIDVGRSRGRFRALMLRSLDRDIQVYSVRVTFANGETQDLAYAGLLRAGSNSGVIDMSGHRRGIERVDLVYRTRGLLRSRANVELLGLH
ncbi:MAG TPA: hypothetical protein PK264_10365 [Hyphomicrobiaceae bacterium]|nr:hypothetical protein [Hyphomicrobiaceae bacterium]